MSAPGRRRCGLAALLALAAALSAAQGAQGAQGAPGAPGAQGAQGAQAGPATAGEDIVVRLVTIDPSRPIYTWWGHSALIVERRGQARFYNYGLFSFEAQNFVLNFAMGRLWFQVGVTSAARELEYEKLYDRGIRVQTLNLPPEARLGLLQALEHDVRPENRVYLYEHYTDNCATRVRDRLDQATGGRLAAIGAAPGRQTLREHTRRHTARSFLMDWVLMFLMSGVIDSPLTRWEEMFLPGELERNVRLVRLPDGQGGEVPLVAAEAVYHSPRHPYPVPEQPPVRWPWGLAAGCAAGAAAAALGLALRRGVAPARALRALFGAWSALIGGVFGSLGTVLFLMACFTDHTVTYGNENLFLANPLTLIALPLGLLLMGKGGSKPRRGRWLAGLWCLLAALAALYLTAKLGALGLSALGSRAALIQRNELAVATIAPVLAGLAAGALAGRLGGFSREARTASAARPRGRRRR